MTARRTTTKADGLVGLFFLGDPESGWQGTVVSKVDDDYYLVQLFSWMTGSPTCAQLIEAARLRTFWFYVTMEDWHDGVPAWERWCDGHRTTSAIPEQQSEV